MKIEDRINKYLSEKELTPSKKQIEILCKKIKYYPNFNKQYGGSFTYSEILILVNYFKVDMAGNANAFEYITRKSQEGKQGSTWFYFYIQKHNKLKQFLH